MDKEFVPYELALKLKEIGFDERCLAGYYNDGKSLWFFRFHKNSEREPTVAERFATAPLWQEAFDWFREKHNLFCKIDFFQSDEFEGLNYDYSIFDLLKPFKEDGITDNPLIDYSVNETYYFKYEEARQACLEKLIELCKKN